MVFDKIVYLAHLESTYNVKKENMAFVGDDYFDLSMFKTLFWTFAPSDAPRIIRQNCLYLLKSKGGQGVVQELYDFLVGKGIVEDATENDVAELDKKENVFVMCHTGTRSKAVCKWLKAQGYNHCVNVFDKFKKVYSGHYHTRSDNGKIFYLGNPYEMFWNDLEDTRGFHLFDTETLEHTPVNNPYRMFYTIYYNDHNYQTFDTRELENKIVKVIVRKKSSPKKFEKFIDKLYNSNVHELKIVENFQLQENEDFEAFESEDTLSILNRYVEESEINLDKSRVQEMLQTVYQEACELV